MYATRTKEDEQNHRIRDCPSRGGMWKFEVEVRRVSISIKYRRRGRGNSTLTVLISLGTCFLKKILARASRLSTSLNLLQACNPLRVLMQMPVSAPWVGLCRHTQERASKCTGDQEKPEQKWEVGVDILLRVCFLYESMGSALIFSLLSLSSILARLIYSVTTQKWMQLVLKTLSFPRLVGYIYHCTRSPR